MDQRTEGAGKTMGYGGCSCRWSVCLIGTLASSPPSTSPISGVSLTMQRPYKRRERTGGEEGFRGRDLRSSCRKGVAPVGTQGAST